MLKTLPWHPENYISSFQYQTRFWISNYQFDIRNSIFDNRTAAVFHLIRVKKPSLAFGTLPNIKFLISKLTFNARFWISNNQFDIRNSLFQLPHISVEAYRTCDLPRGGRSRPPAFIRIRTCFFFKTFFTYLRIFHWVLNHFTRLYKVRTWPITWYLETEVR